MCCNRWERAIAARAHVHCGGQYDALASCVLIAVEKLLARQTAEEGSPLANQAVRARVFEMLQVLLSADLFEEEGEGALAAQGLGQKVEAGLRAALVEVAP